MVLYDTENSAMTRGLAALCLAIGLALGATAAQATPGGEAGPPAEVVGELQVLVGDDFENRTSTRMHFVEDRRTGEHLRLRFGGSPPLGLRSGDTVRVRGQRQGDELLLAADGDGAGTEVLAAEVSSMLGEQRTLVIAGHLQDQALACSAAEIRDLMFDESSGYTVAGLFEGMSFGKVWLTGQVAGLYTIPSTTADGCTPFTWATELEAAAAADGIDHDAYDRVVFVIPRNGCPYSGLGQVGGSKSRSWVLHCDLEDVYAHELGHNAGMNHAGNASSSYGDTSDIMGFGGLYLRELNAPHHEQMAWQESSQIEEVTASGVYEVAPLELDANEAVVPQTLKVAKPDTGEWYYLSYRAPIGFDANLPSGLFDKLQIHRYGGNGGETTYLKALRDGEVYSDAANDISFTAQSHDAESFTVHVDFGGGGPTCAPGTPLLSIVPGHQNGFAGDVRSYSISLENADGAGCATSSFSLASSVPNGWTGTLTPSTLSLAPGQQGSATLSVTSASGAAEGTYSVHLDATDASRATSASASYGVDPGPCSPGPIQATLNPTSQSGGAGAVLSYGLQVSNADDASCPATTVNLAAQLPAGWSGQVLPANLSLAPGTAGMATLTVASTASTVDGSYAVGAIVVDSADAGRSAVASGVAVVDAPQPPPRGDEQAPTTPSGVSASAKKKHINIAWSASSDNVGVAGYTVLRDGVPIAQVGSTGFSDHDVARGATYSYEVVAFDEAGNASAPGGPSAATLGGGGGSGGGRGKGKNR